MGALDLIQSTSMQSSSLCYCNIILFLPWGGKVSLWENEHITTISPGTEAQRAKGNTVSFSFPSYGQEEYPVTFRAWRNYGQTSELSRTRIKIWIILSEGVLCTRDQNKTIIYNIEINQMFKVRHVYCLLPSDAVVVSLQSRVGKVSGTKTETICN